jgi:hypothetical protein
VRPAVPFTGQHGSIFEVHVGAILTVPGRVQLQHRTAQASFSVVDTGALAISPLAQWDVLGKSVLDRTIERLQAFGVGEIAVIPEPANPPQIPNTFWSAWEAAVANCLKFDLETLLIIRVGPYVELDLPDFLRFHRETSSAMTQVYDPRGALDLVAINTRRLAREEGSFRGRLRNLIPGHQRYHFTGYSNRLSTTSDFRRLVRDALVGIAHIRPIGKEVSANVWLGKDARLDRSAVILPPAYIGNYCRINAGCVIRESSAIEQQSLIDCGTTVDDSCILPGTYIGAGLRLCGTIVHQETLFHLGRNLELRFNDHKLFGRTFSGKALLPRIRSTAAAPYTQSIMQ